MLNRLPGARLEVWGDPIAHSRSPQLHVAAYRTLGLSWTYERRRVGESAFASQLHSLDERWRGLSLTMPLKGVAFATARTHDRRAKLTGAANTLLLADDGPHGFNTDVGGIVEAFREAGVDSAERGRIVGAGATATSALVALAELGAREVTVVARRREAVCALSSLAAALAVRVVPASFDDENFAPSDVTVATLPGGAVVAEPVADALAADGGALLDAVYGHWPTVLSLAWTRAGGAAQSGLGMLLHQAILQIRIFTSGTPDAPLPDEPTVLAAMRDAVMQS